MSINAIGSSSSLASTQALQQTRRHQGGPDLTNTAELLGTSTDDLQTQLKSGTTLADLAKQKGVSTDDLMNAIKTDIKAGKPDGAPDLSDDQLTQMASGIASGQKPQGPGGPHGPGGPGGPGGPPPMQGVSSTSSTDDDDDDDTVNTNLNSLADALGTNPDELRSLLSSVQDLGSLLEKSGVTGYGSAGKSVATSGLAVDQYA